MPHVREVIPSDQLEEKLAQFQKMEAVGRLAGGIAHDFNNLLTVILGCSELLLDRCRTDAKALGLVQDIKNAGDRAALLTRQLLTFSRKQIARPVVLDLNGVVTNLATMLKRLLRENIRLTTSLDPALGLIEADPGQVEQVIMNLVVNAGDAMPQGGELTIETATARTEAIVVNGSSSVRPGFYTMLAVRDTGCGMDEDTQARIFEPFFTTKEPGKGTGLGLATVYGIVRQCQGHIRVTSKFGAGSQFRVYFPQVESPVPAGQPEAARTLAPSGKETILLVEDDGTVRSLARETLQAKGYTVLEASHGPNAIYLAENYPGPIDLLLTDVAMPYMSGFQLATCLAPYRPQMKVLYTTGYTDSTVSRNGGKDAAANILMKPFTPEVLAGRVREVMDG